MSTVSFGVHFGRSSICLAVEKDGRCDVVANDAGDRVTPAVVGFTENEILVGLSAKQLSVRKPGCIAMDSKGKIAEDDMTDYEIIGDGFQKKVKVESVHRKIFEYMKDIASSHSVDEVSSQKTVITVPVEFNSHQRDIVSKCASNAGFNVSQVISEPAAAILAYHIGQIDPLNAQKCLVFRCGGKSSTAALILVTGGMISVQHVVSKPIGGDIVTDLMVELLAQEFKRKNKVDPRETKRGKLKLQVNAENVKHVLSTMDTANCYIESLYEGIDFNANVSRSRFDMEFTKVLPKFLNPIKELLEVSDINSTDIQQVILCGGTTKIPKLQKAVNEMFTKAELLNTINQDEVIAVGAANQASILNDELDINLNADGSTVTIQATTHDLVYSYMEQKNETGPEQQILIPKNCPIPIRKSHHLQTSDQGSITVKVFLKSTELMELAELTIKDLDPKSEVKPSLSAHIHRDGSLHISLSDKSSNKSDQKTFPCSSK